jgi:hypothetical protein
MTAAGADRQTQKCEVNLPSRWVLSLCQKPGSLTTRNRSDAQQVCNSRLWSRSGEWRMRTREPFTERENRHVNLLVGRGRMAAGAIRWLSSCWGVRCLRTRTLRVRASSPSENVAADHWGFSPHTPNHKPPGASSSLGVTCSGGGWPLEPFFRSPAAREFAIANSILDLGVLTPRSQCRAPGALWHLGLCIGSGGRS